MDAYLAEHGLSGSTPPGWQRVQAICDFVHNHIAFDYRQARPAGTAWEAYNERVGVCGGFTRRARADHARPRCGGCRHHHDVRSEFTGELSGFHRRSLKPAQKKMTPAKRASVRLQEPSESALKSVPQPDASILDRRAIGAARGEPADHEVRGRLNSRAAFNCSGVLTSGSDTLTRALARETCLLCRFSNLLSIFILLNFRPTWRPGSPDTWNPRRSSAAPDRSAPASSE
jgi:hypothetical protein